MPNKKISINVEVNKILWNDAHKRAVKEVNKNNENSNVKVNISKKNLVDYILAEWLKGAN